MMSCPSRVNTRAKGAVLYGHQRWDFERQWPGDDFCDEEYKPAVQVAHEIDSSLERRPRGFEISENHVNLKKIPVPLPDRRRNRDRFCTLDPPHNYKL
jgi:hypothetical protein